MAATEYSGFLILPFEEDGKWRAKIRRPYRPVRVEGNLLPLWLISEHCATEAEAIELAKKQIDAGTVS